MRARGPGDAMFRWVAVKRQHRDSTMRIERRSDLLASFKSARMKGIRQKLTSVRALKARTPSSVDRFAVPQNNRKNEGLEKGAQHGV